ncbi:transposase [Dietzia kunjamensis]|uniref:Transposase n=1 Tax=Dietzia maris TaxID=37915 RepID=A0ABT8GXS0_9ACTN|nr:transposase [Dietzia maris]MDN4505015.1 transposase [Dietzia maris]
MTVLVDLPPLVASTDAARLLDTVQGRSAKPMTNWVEAGEQPFRVRIKVVTMDRFAGFHSAAAKAGPAARTVTDPFHFVNLAADELTVCRQRVQQTTAEHRGRSGVAYELPVLARLGRSLRSRRAENLGCFDAGASNGPVEAINGRLEILRGIALGVRNLGTISSGHPSTPADSGVRINELSNRKSRFGESAASKRSRLAHSAHPICFGRASESWCLPTGR